MTINQTLDALRSARTEVIHASQTGLDDSTKRKLRLAFDALNQPTNSRTVLAGEFRWVCGELKTLGIFESDVFQPKVSESLVANLKDLERKLMAELATSN